MRVFLYLFTALSLIGLSLWGGYEYGWYKANWSKRLAQQVPFVEEYSKVRGFPEGVYRERDLVVLFGKVGNFNQDRGTLEVIVYDSRRFVIKINKNTQFDSGSISITKVKSGDYVRLDMKYSEPFVANRIIFTRQ